MKKKKLIEYVAGFYGNKNHVLLVKKNKPEWMAGLWNGIGGKIEEGEPSRTAMVREWKEEVGEDTHESDWEQFCILTIVSADAKVYFFRREQEDDRILAGFSNKVNDVGELMMPWSMDSIVTQNTKTVDNLRWILPMAFAKDKVCAKVDEK